jgi:hypothetical protein
MRLAAEQGAPSTAVTMVSTLAATARPSEVEDRTAHPSTEAFKPDFRVLESECNKAPRTVDCSCRCANPSTLHTMDNWSQLQNRALNAHQQDFYTHNRADVRVGVSTSPGKCPAPVNQVTLRLGAEGALSEIHAMVFRVSGRVQAGLFVLVQVAV